MMSREAAIRAFQQDLSRWYKKNGRHDLPWRNTSDAYAIYISEIMLQQTQVATVRARFYEPFMKRFPSMKVLADADLEEVLAVWQGLGYYRRAGHLHAAAKQAKGKMPITVEELMELPGIGRNTAHAVAAFAYRHPVPVMEANVKRVISRIFALEDPVEADLWQGAELLLNKRDPFDHNQAMMDIGSMVCTPRAPKCPECPANIICSGQNEPERYPAAKKKKEVPVRKKNIIVEIDRSNRISATPRATKFLQGLYHFREQDVVVPLGSVKLGEVEQKYSHFTLRADVYLLRHDEKRNDSYSLRQLEQLPMSMAEKKILRLIKEAGTAKA
jgi:A/G-specific adenine glycosylase